MKKILTLLSAVSLTATASASVVACGNGGGETTKPPTTEVYKLSEVFVDKEIEKIDITYNPYGQVFPEQMYAKMYGEIIKLNFKNEKSKIGEVSTQNGFTKIFGELKTYYSENGNNENFNNIKKVAEGLDSETHEIKNYKFKMDIIHKDIIEANKKENALIAKGFTEKLQEGVVEITVKSLNIKVS